MAWVLLVAAGLLETVWAVMLKLSDGLGFNLATAIFAVSATMSFLLLAEALKDLPVGTGYAAWTGIGAVGAAIAGMVWLGEPASALRFAGIIFVAAGIGALSISGSHA